MSRTISGPDAQPFQEDQLLVPVGRPLGTMIVRGLTVCAILVTAGFAVSQAYGLWTQWSQLQVEIGGAQNSQIIGYRDIAPLASYAVGPGDWFRQEGDQSLLWANWEHGVGHKWFHFRRGDIDKEHLWRPDSIFVSRAIDYPLIETGGGEIWVRIPPESPVVGHTLLGRKCVYPVLVLGKVQVVNDLVNDHPFLIVSNAFAPSERAVSIFDANLNGERVTMAATGYFHDGKPVLFDRGAQSLWMEKDESLTSVTGEHRGLKLTRIAHLTPVTWKTWLKQNRDSRLVVGADRSRGVPDK